MDGIQGPEVTFMGKSIPLATGILPMAAAVLGARRGIKRGIEKVQGPSGDGGYRREKELLEKYKTKERQRRKPTATELKKANDALREYRKMQSKMKIRSLNQLLPTRLVIQLSSAFWIRFRIHEAGA